MRFHPPRALVVRAWFWLAAQTDDLHEKHRCLEAILELEPGSEAALGVLQWVEYHQQAVDSIHPANAEELANIAEETAAEVLCGALRYPSDSGGWQLGDLDLSGHLAKYRDHKIVVTIASTGVAAEEKAKYVCGICGFALNELGECPRCRLQVEETAKRLRRRRRRQELLQEIDQIVEEKWEDEEDDGDGP